MAPLHQPGLLLGKQRPKRAVGDYILGRRLVSRRPPAQHHLPVLERRRLQHCIALPHRHRRSLDAIRHHHLQFIVSPSLESRPSPPLMRRRRTRRRNLPSPWRSTFLPLRSHLHLPWPFYALFERLAIWQKLQARLRLKKYRLGKRSPRAMLRAISHLPEFQPDGRLPSPPTTPCSGPTRIETR